MQPRTAIVVISKSNSGSCAPMWCSRIEAGRRAGAKWSAQRWLAYPRRSARRRGGPCGRIVDRHKCAADLHHGVVHREGWTREREGRETMDDAVAVRPAMSARTRGNAMGTARTSPDAKYPKNPMKSGFLWDAGERGGLIRKGFLAEERGPALNSLGGEPRNPSGSCGEVKLGASPQVFDGARRVESITTRRQAKSLFS